jgi:hypothetical protein
LEMQHARAVGQLDNVRLTPLLHRCGSSSHYEHEAVRSSLLDTSAMIAEARNIPSHRDDTSGGALHADGHLPPHLYPWYLDDERQNGPNTLPAHGGQTSRHSRGDDMTRRRIISDDHCTSHAQLLSTSAGHPRPGAEDQSAREKREMWSGRYVLRKWSSEKYIRGRMNPARQG